MKNEEKKDITNDDYKINESYDIYKENQEKNIQDPLITNLIKRICVLDFKKTNKNEGIHYNNFCFNNIKISSINIPKTDLIGISVSSKDTKSSIIRLFLLNMIVSFLNYVGNKNDFFKSKNYNGLNSINKMNQINFINFLNYKIYDTFIFIPIQIHFGKIIQKIFKKRALYIKDIYYKNYYLVDLNTNKTILSLESLHNKNKDSEPGLKSNNQNKIWNELLFHCQNLKKDYIKKNKMNFSGMDYQNFFVKIVYRTTYPKRTFVIKFLPLFNGMCIIHEYIQLKLSTFEKEEKKEYKEKKIIYGYDAYDNIFRNSSSGYFENEHPILKKVHFFLIESLFCSNSTISFFFILTKNPKIYFSEEILEIIDNQVDKYLENNKSYFMKLKSDNHYYFIKKIIQKIINILYEEYIQINNTEKILHKSSSVIQKKAELNFKDIISGNSTLSMKISKNEALIYLFDSINFNKNIDPNDITIDLNDEKKNNNNLVESLIPRGSDLTERNSKPSFRLSDLLSEKISLPPSHQKKKTEGYQINPFPLDSDNNNMAGHNLKIDLDKKIEEMSIGTKIKKNYNLYNKDTCKVINGNNIFNKNFINNTLNNNFSSDISCKKYLIKEKNFNENFGENGDNKFIL